MVIVNISYYNITMYKLVPTVVNKMLQSEDWLFEVLELFRIYIHQKLDIGPHRGN